MTGPTVGFIGLGNMGLPMALRVQEAHSDLIVYDQRPEPMDQLVALGARPAPSVAAMAAEADVLLTCVLYDHQVRDIFLAPDGIVANGREGLVATVHSTVPPTTIEEIVSAAAERGVQIVDAPVSGASIAAEAGTLTIILGGTPAAVEKVRPVLEAAAEHLIHVGDAGLAQVAKLGNNIMFLGNQLIAMEAVRFVEAFGLDRDVLFEVAKVSTGASWGATHFDHFDRYGAEHTLAGTAELPHRFGKDLRHAVAIAQERCTYLPLSALGSQLLPGLFAERWRTGVTDEDAT
jgi:3-hydroxyisobutyrate dehydrogenase